MDYNQLTSRTPPRPKKYNFKRKANAASPGPSSDTTINLLTLDVPPQFMPSIEPHELPLFKGSERIVRVGGNLTTEEEVQLLTLLHHWADVFDWDVNVLTGISPMIICHSLNADPEFKPIRQARQHKSEEQWVAAAEEVEKLLASGCVEKVVCPK